MNSKYMPFNDEANLLITDQLVRTDILVAALALAVSNTLHLPTTEVDDPSSYFNLQILPSVTGIISDWNENMVLDAQAVVKQAASFWLVRYTAAYPCSGSMYSADYGFFDTVFGVNRYVEPCLMGLLNGPHKGTILKLANSACALIKQQPQQNEDK